MESQQHAAEQHASVESEQDMTKPTEQLDVSRTPPKEKSTLAQVIVLSRRGALIANTPSVQTVIYLRLALLP